MYFFSVRIQHNLANPILIVHVVANVCYCNKCHNEHFSISIITLLCYLSFKINLKEVQFNFAVLESSRSYSKYHDELTLFKGKTLISQIF